MAAVCSSISLFMSALSEKFPVRYSENRKKINGDLPHFAPKEDKLPRERQIKRMSLILDYYPFCKIWNLFRYSPFSFGRNRQDRMQNRFYVSFRMAENTKRTP